MTALEQEIESLARAARAAARPLAALSTEVKNRALRQMAEALVSGHDAIIAANARDLDAGKQAGLSAAMLDRLMLDPKRIEAMAQGLREIEQLADPVGEITGMKRRPNGLMVGRMRVPLGVVGIIYESRPNVTADTAALCLKSGNAVVLRGGSEAIHSNRAIAEALGRAASSAGVPEGAITLVPTTDREAVRALLQQERYIDLVIPRGGYELINFVTKNSLIPVVKHDKGVCHLYVDRAADLAMAETIAFNAKVQRPGVCNATEAMLVHADVAERFLPSALDRLAAAGVEIRGCPRTRAIWSKSSAAKDTDWGEEFLDLILAVRVVDSLDEAIEHIARYGSGHTESIITGDLAAAGRFLREVDSSAVIVNASTRFNDGGQFGLGAEIGISTQKLHARGPMGLEELTSLKFIVLGDGHIRG
ncbi:MAG: glutamate-5-semialdehyde dehydrogenase [Nitrospinae bacterium]|nr:glutamate-5-semialdehyde dehydrogenase [Nitrospinota bacterium]